MKLNHIDLQVPDVQATAAFFEAFLGFTHQSSRTSPAIAILTDGDGFSLVLQRLKDATERYPDGFHVGSLVERVEDVHGFHTAARAAGLDISDVIENNRGVLTYCRAPGVLVEVSWHRPRAARLAASSSGRGVNRGRRVVAARSAGPPRPPLRCAQEGTTGEPPCQSGALRAGRPPRPASGVWRAASGICPQGARLTRWFAGGPLLSAAKGGRGGLTTARAGPDPSSRRRARGASRRRAGG